MLSRTLQRAVTKGGAALRLVRPVQWSVRLQAARSSSRSTVSGDVPAGTSTSSQNSGTVSGDVPAGTSTSSQNSGTVSGDVPAGTSTSSQDSGTVSGDVPAGTSTSSQNSGTGSGSGGSEGPAGKSDWWYASWGALASLILGGPLFFLFELRYNLETRLWAEERFPELVSALEQYLDVFGDGDFEANGRHWSVMQLGGDGEEESFDDGRAGGTSEQLYEAALDPASEDRDSGNDGSYGVMVDSVLVNGLRVQL
jgi:hypothetical protein